LHNVEYHEAHLQETLSCSKTLSVELERMSMTWDLKLTCKAVCLDSQWTADSNPDLHNQSNHLKKFKLKERLIEIEADLYSTFIIV